MKVSLKKIIVLLISFLVIVSTSFAADVSENTDAISDEIAYTGYKAKRDPFNIPAILINLTKKPHEVGRVQQRALPEVNIQGVIWSKRLPQVIINDKVMRVGDRIKEFEIREITKKGIVLFYKGKYFPIEIRN